MSQQLIYTINAKLKISKTRGMLKVGNVSEQYEVIISPIWDEVLVGLYNEY